MVEKRHALGSGLDAPDQRRPRRARTARPARRFEVDIDLLAPNRVPAAHAHRGRGGIDELAAVDQGQRRHPADPRRAATGGGYQIIAGERRWRAAQRAGLLEVPVVVREVPEGRTEAARDGAHREHPARGPQRRSKRPQRLPAPRRRVRPHAGSDRRRPSARTARRWPTSCACSSCPQDVRDDVAGGTPLDGPRARASWRSNTEQEQRSVARDVVARGWSVRETEQMVTHALTHAERGPAPRKKGVRRAKPDVHTRAAQDKLRLTFGTKVDIARNGKGGEIRIAFKNEEELHSHLRAPGAGIEAS
ncbi:MAG: ParB N-terminal domain-containing protein [Candidatus Moduliflexus flocculans]|nr:ParB N-terminal domain-containing protein [Candidatus Moduliflexus flocculans]